MSRCKRYVSAMPDAIIDTHAHVFLRDRPMAPNRRYTPGYDAPLDAYLAVLERYGVARGVLVQPSFYGTDNSYLLESLAMAAGRLRGVVVVHPDVSDAELAAYAHAGVVGARFNLIGDDCACLFGSAYQSLLRRLSALHWQIEIQADGPEWPAVLKALEAVDAAVVADHFGRPDPARGVSCPGFQALLAQGGTGRVFVKLSAAYRGGAVDAAPYADALLQRLGPERLLWGSDWPWTQHEAGQSFPKLFGFERSGDRSCLSRLFATTAKRLFRF